MAEHNDDHTLINGLKADDERSQRLLVNRYGGYLLSFAMKFGLSREDALEVVNDIFYKTIKNINSFDTNRGTKFTTWLIQIAKNSIIDKLRVLNRSSVESIEEREEKGFQVTEGSWQVSDCPDSDAGLLAKKLLQKALDNLNETDRIILLERAYGQKFKEIGKLLNKKVNAVKVAHHRALAKLKHAYITLLESLEDKETKEVLKIYLMTEGANEKRIY